MGPRLSIWSLSPLDRYSKMKRRWVLPRWDHIFLILEVKETFPTIHVRRGSLEVKRESCQPTHRPLHWNPSWLRDGRTHMGGPWDKPNTDSEPGKARWLAKGNAEEMPHVSDSNYHEGTILSLSQPVWVYSHVLFFLLINTLLVSLLSPSGNLFIQSWRARALSLATGPWWSSG